MANAWNWLVFCCSLRILLRGTFSLSPGCSIDCQTHCLIDCRQGYYYTAGNCLECPTGFYCPGGQAAPRKCPLGTANVLTAQADITACQVCPSGYLSLESGAGCRACPEGYSCHPQSGVQRSCAPGQYSPEGDLECQECPETYICPDGQSRQHCGAGEQPNPSRTQCVTSAPGPFPREDSLLCQPCPAGHFCPDGLAVPPCPAGSFKPKEELHPPSSSSSSCLPGLYKREKRDDQRDTQGMSSVHSSKLWSKSRMSYPGSQITMCTGRSRNLVFSCSVVMLGLYCFMY